MQIEKERAKPQVCAKTINKTSSIKHTVTNQDKQKQATKKLQTISKKLEQNEYNLNLEHKKSKDIQSQMNAKIHRTNNSKLKIEEEIDMILKQLNEKEAKIYNIQKINMEEFESEGSQYQQIYLELLKKQEQKGETLEDLNNQKEILFNNYIMGEGDYESHIIESARYKENIKLKLLKLKEIEASFPEDFKFIKDNFKLQSDLNKYYTQVNDNLKEIRTGTKEAKKGNASLKVIDITANNYKEEMSEIQNQIEVENKNETLNGLESQILRHIPLKFLWNHLKELMSDYYFESCFNAENNEYGTNLNTKWSNKLMKLNEHYLENKKEREHKLQILQNRNTQIQNNNNNTSMNSHKTINNLEMENNLKLIQGLSAELTGIERSFSKLNEMYCSFIDTLENDFESGGEEQRATLVLNGFINISVTTLLTTAANETENNNYIKSLTLYAKEGDNRIRIKSSLDKQYDNITNTATPILSEQASLQNKLKEIESTKLALEARNKQLNKDIKNTQETISIRNKNLRSNGEQLSESNFKEYVKLNESIFKNMKSIYGPKIVSKVKKIQKEKYYENIIIDHTTKAEMINNLISFISNYQTEMHDINAHISLLMQQAQEGDMEIAKNIQMINQTQKEKEILDVSTVKLKETIDNVIENQENEVVKEKEKGIKQYNINYYVERIKLLLNTLKSCNEEQIKYQSQMKIANDAYTTKEQKLHFEGGEGKSNGINIKMGINDDPLVITQSPFKHAQSSNLEDLNNNKHDGGFIKRTGTQDLEQVVVNSLNRFIENDDTENDPLNNILNNQIIKDTTKNGFYEQLRPGLNGMTLYKRFNSIPVLSQINNFAAGSNSSPEQCGYVIRLFKIDGDSETLAIINPNRMRDAPEMSVSLTDLQGLLYENNVKAMMKKKHEKELLGKGGKDEGLNKDDNIPFTLITKENNLDGIASSYYLFVTFESCCKEIISNKRGGTAKLSQIKSTLNKNISQKTN